VSYQISLDQPPIDRIMTIPRPEYPRPILYRSDWKNLNGQWAFDYDPDDLGLIENWYQGHEYGKTILVPFTVESEASGLHDTSPPDVIWYEREFEHPGWLSEKVLVNFGACDYETRVFINGLEVGQHRGGYSPFSFDITHVLNKGSNRITVRVQDSNSWMQPRGKQEGTTRWPIDYDSVTGIWQTVWLEPVNTDHITEIAASYEMETEELSLTLGLSTHFYGELEVNLQQDGSIIATQLTQCDGRSEVRVILKMDNPDLWSPADPRLVDVKLRLIKQSETIDSVQSYTGLREISIQDGKTFLNGSPLYLRGVLDQGYFPLGWYTPVDDDAIIKDIELTKAMGFNLARKHQKAEDPRYLYWADKLGLMIWAEMPSGKIYSTELIEALSREWTALIRRDRGHPCIISWVPFNESWGVWHIASRPEQRAFVDSMFHLTKALDPTRPVIGNDGWEYSSGDLWTLHIYEGGEQPISEKLDNVLKDPSSLVADVGHHRKGALPNSDVTDLPVLLTECGGIGFLPPDFEGDEFAYGSIPGSTHDLEQRIESVAHDINQATRLSGFVWTQLTDIQQEINGLLYLDRTPKLPIDILHTTFSNIRRD
jgi:beta-galactosidase/beta-glucuronidase